MFPNCPSSPQHWEEKTKAACPSFLVNLCFRSLRNCCILVPLGEKVVDRLLDFLLHRGRKIKSLQTRWELEIHSCHTNILCSVPMLYLILAKTDMGSMYYSFENQQQFPYLLDSLLSKCSWCCWPIHWAFPSLPSCLASWAGVLALLSCKHLLGWGDNALLLRSWILCLLLLTSSICPVKTHHFKNACPKAYLMLVNINYYYNLKPKLQMFTVILSQFLMTFSHRWVFQFKCVFSSTVFYT